MPSYPTKYGPVLYSNVPMEARTISQNKCIYSDPPFSKRHEEVKLQLAALDAFRAAEVAFGKRIAKDNGWSPSKAKSRAIRLSGIGWRDYDYQASLYASDSSRYAKPWVSRHVQGICIDVDTSQPQFDTACSVLLAVGWRRVRSDEPWHFSWGVLV